MERFFASAGSLLLTLVYSGIFFMINIFVSGGIAQAKQLSNILASVLDASVYIVPLICIAPIILVFMGRARGWEIVYRWLFLPPVLFIFWLIVLFIIYKFTPGK